MDRQKLREALELGAAKAACVLVKVGVTVAALPAVATIVTIQTVVVGATVVVGVAQVAGAAIIDGELRVGVEQIVTEIRQIHDFINKQPSIQDGYDDCDAVLDS